LAAQIEISEIREAEQLMRKYFAPSRLLSAPSLSKITGANVFLKLESDLPTASFKVRGALYALSAKLRRGAVKEVVAASTGNHGAAVAYAARALGIPARIFLPTAPNPIKRRRIAELNAQIVEDGEDITAAICNATEYAQTHDAYFLHDATDPDVPLGPANIFSEVHEQLPGANTIVVPIGDSALIRGIASAAKLIAPATKIIGVQAERAPSYFLSWKSREVIVTDTCDTIADGLATRVPIADNVASVVDLVDDIRLVSDAQMLRAIRHLLIEEHVVAEAAGAASTAALLQSSYSWSGNVVLLVTGANISPETLRRAAMYENDKRLLPAT
jgi:threonine dehydratase